MTKIEKLFFHTKMTWLRVILLSVVTGVLIGLIMIPDFLDDTSFQNPGTTVEFWILWALFIILNCEKPLEAGLKTFIAFLISQPVIYLVQVPFSWRGWDIFSYYKFWFIITLLTFPGGIIAWFVKKGNFLSVAILSVANGILCFMIPSFFQKMLECFPHHLLTIIFMLAEIVFFILLILKNKKHRIAAFIIAAILLVVSLIYTSINANAPTSVSLETEGTAPYTLVSEHDLFTVTFNESFAQISYKASEITEDGEATVVYRDSEGNEYELHLQYGNGSISNAIE